MRLFYVAGACVVVYIAKSIEISHREKVLKRTPSSHNKGAISKLNP
jgi:hypothetical protein